jgi:hypothetical protein
MCALRRERSRIRRGGNRGEIVLREIVRETVGGRGVVTWPTFTKTNYTDRAILMRLQGTGLREAVDTGNITKSPEMVQVLDARGNAKAA